MRDSLSGRPFEEEQARAFKNPHGRGRWNTNLPNHNREGLSEVGSDPGSGFKKSKGIIRLHPGQ
jgi:hypothetical protein